MKNLRVGPTGLPWTVNILHRIDDRNGCEWRFGWRIDESKVVALFLTLIVGLPVFAGAAQCIQVRCGSVELIARSRGKLSLIREIGFLLKLMPKISSCFAKEYR